MARERDAKNNPPIAPRTMDRPPPAMRGTSPAPTHAAILQEKLASRHAKRALKAAERRDTSDALKEAGNAFFQVGRFEEALERYQRAIDVHGPCHKPALLTSLAATYLQLGRYPEAEDAADRALTADPRSIHARYHRGMARKQMDMWTAAAIDFRTLLTLEPDNADAKAQLAYVEAQHDPLFLDDDDAHTYSSDEAPAPTDEPQLGESLSESSDCEHQGNGVPCKFYNRTECNKGRACRFSHAPDEKSERDGLGRNVCLYYLIGACKFGERCSYAHSKEYLLQTGWWSTAEGIEKKKRWYNFAQMLNKAYAEYTHQNATGTGQASKRKGKGKKNRGRKRKRSEPGSKSQSFGLQSTAAGEMPMVIAYPSWGYDADVDVDVDEDYERDMEDGMCGFTGSQVNELLSFGVKPWDDDAWDVLYAVHSEDY